MIKVSFHGAAGTVTGSNYLVETNHGTFVVDCGMFQGPGVEQLNLEDLQYDPKKVNFTLLTHAHIDHSGMLPKLVKHGFNGNIYATPNTIRITTELLLDAAKIQESNYERGDFYGKYTQVKAIVYNTSDAQNTIAMLRSLDTDETIEPLPGIKITFKTTGHILGAVNIIAEIEDEGQTKKIIFSGDIGRLKSPLIETFDINFTDTPDYVIMESLYGGIIHQDRDESDAQLIDLINETIDRGGCVYIPSFAVQRTQEVLNDLKRAIEQGRLDKKIPVWLDSPLAQRVTNIYRNALIGGESLFDFEGLNYVKKFKQSMKISGKPGNIIIAGSGMADGGRIVDHLSRGLSNPKNSVIFVGFQAEGTLGRALVEGDKNVVIGTRSIPVRAKIHQVEGFSAHGDTNDYTAWLKRFNTDNLKKIFLVHAEPERAEALKKHFESIGINKEIIPTLHESVTL